MGDIPMPRDLIDSVGNVPGGPMLHLPIAVGSVSVFYNQQVRKGVNS